MSHDLPSFLEDDISQVPALLLLQNLGYRYLTPAEADAERGGRRSNVLLEGVLRAQLRRLNKVRFKGAEHEFTEGNVLAAVEALKVPLHDGLIRTNEKLYDLLTLGKSLPQSIQGDTKSFPLRYIDRDEPRNNVFHVAEEFAVERTGSHETRRPDLVLFVNGIPLVVIECKRPDLDEALEQAVSQQIRNQREDEVPGLFVHAQLLLALSKNAAKYGTAGTASRFWSVWKEKENADAALAKLINRPLSSEDADRLFADRAGSVRAHFEGLTRHGGRAVTDQDRAIHALCRPERLLRLMFRYTLFDAGEKKVARYQQFFCVERILERIRARDQDGKRTGGVVWHTQGSGKSLTMVMLAQAIALEPGLDDAKVVLVTDRVDLDDQIYRTFRHCGTEPVRARSGRDLAAHILDVKSRIITTVVDKFETAVDKVRVRNEGPNVFVLVDEAHRGHYGEMNARMRKALPNACFIAFTGTPVVKREKNTIRRFGGLIDTYTITQAVADKAVVPLLYEGRDVEQHVDRAAIDGWFDKLTSSLTTEQRADLKKKFATANQLGKTEQRVMRIAWDISAHYRDNWQGTPYKAQLVTPDKSTALLYKKYLDQFGLVSAEVLISGPDDREGNDDVFEANTDAVSVFWKKMMDKHGGERAYNVNVINAFKHAEDPEIIVVVEKLITGFDAPRNTVLYLTRTLKDHTLLQAIARVNRLCEGKDFGYVIDYQGVLQGLSEALDLYGQLADYDRADLEGTLTDVGEEVRKLPQRYSDLWDVFKGVRNKKDEEAYERHLAEKAVRDQFYERLSAYARTLAIALSSIRFLEEAPEPKRAKYKADLEFFMKLRSAVRLRYAEVVNFKDYEAKIQKLLDTHVGTGEVEPITDLVNIFDKEAFAAEVAKLDGDASKADTIAFRTKRTITERFQEDPAFYRKFSEMLEDAIRAFREKRLSDAEYLRKVSAIRDAVRDRRADGLPPILRDRDAARSYYGVIRETLAGRVTDEQQMATTSAEAAVRVDDVIGRHRIVNWAQNADVQNRMRNEIEDYLHELKAERGFDLPFEAIDAILEKCLDIARVKAPS